MPDDIPPLWCGIIQPGQRVIVRDPLGVSLHGGPGIVKSVEIIAGQWWRVDVEVSPNVTLHVPPEWIWPDPAAAANVLPFVRRRKSLPWPARLFRDIPDGAA